jgi:hypothetical protein
MTARSNRPAGPAREFEHGLGDRISETVPLDHAQQDEDPAYAVIGEIAVDVDPSALASRCGPHGQVP